MPTSLYMPDVQVHIAFNAGYLTPAASRVWTDVSAYVELDQLVEIVRGRQDERSTCDSNTLSLVLDNSDGRFTAGLTTGAHYPNVKIGRPIKVTATPPGGSASIRFLGYIDAWPLEWSAGVAAYAAARVTASSRLARIGRGIALPDVITQELSLDDPMAHWPLSEAEGAVAAGDVSGNDALPLKPAGSGAAVTFGTATGPGTDGLTAASFAGGQYLRAPVTLSAQAAGTIECFFLTSPSVDNRPLVRVERQDGLIGEFGLTTIADGTVLGFVSGAGGSGGNVISTQTCDDGQTHHAAVTFGGGSLSLYIDGVLAGTSGPTGGVNVTTDRVHVAGSVGTEVRFSGTVAHVALYTTKLSGTRIAEHADAGLTGFLAETAADRLARYATWAGVPAAELSADAAATTPIQHIDSTGTNPAALMRRVEETEGGVLFDARDNTLTYSGRAVRFNRVSAFTLDMALDQVEAGVNPRLDPTALVNGVTADVTSDASVRAVNAASQTDYGVYDASLSVLTTDYNQAHARAWWLVNRYGQPATRVADLGVNMLALPGATQALVIAADVGTRFLVSNWPTQIGSTYASGFFIEGYTEVFGPESWDLTLNVSPASVSEVFELDHATRGVLDGAYPLAY